MAVPTLSSIVIRYMIPTTLSSFGLEHLDYLASDGLVTLFVRMDVVRIDVRKLDPACAVDQVGARGRFRAAQPGALPGTIVKR